MNNNGESMTDQGKKWGVHIVTSLITSLAVLAGAWFTFQGDIQGSQYVAESNRLEAAFDRIGYLETEMKEKQADANARIVELTSQVFRLRSQLDKDLDVMGLFEEFMDGLPFEAWIKEVHNVNGDIEFRMLTINKRYELAYGVSESKYRGSKDNEIWSDDVAAQFREADLAVLSSKASVVRYQTYPVNPAVPNGKQQTKLIVKVYLELIEGRQMIFGMSIEYPQIRIRQQ